MASVESKEQREQAGRWIDDAPSNLGVLRGLLADYDRLVDRADNAEREAVQLRGLAYELEQTRNRLATSEREGEALRQEVERLRAELDRSRREREEIADALTSFVNGILTRLRPQPE